MPAFEQIPEVTVFAGHDREPHGFSWIENATVRFDTASGFVHAWVQNGQLRLSTLAPGDGGEASRLTIRPVTAHSLEIVPGL